ncbi:hypothetical protein EVAR_85264_1 [Eumeta japonica]|uniref:Uncharacterized protein n=1 Tax=Eumeta variegata TaxID=151549 RepID=A0A4C1V9B8_EUMVA|nr:hypothetical protein EVAR_85264_1 [Eumeta japonica]
MCKFNAPRPFLLLLHLPILRHCDAFVTNFTAAKLRFNFNPGTTSDGDVGRALDSDPGSILDSTGGPVFYSDPAGDRACEPQKEGGHRRSWTLAIPVGLPVRYWYVAFLPTISFGECSSPPKFSLAGRNATEEAITSRLPCVVISPLEPAHFRAA